MNPMYQHGAKAALQKIGVALPLGVLAGRQKRAAFDLPMPATALSPWARRAASTIGGGLVGAGIGAGTAEEGQRGRGALLGGAIGGAGGLAWQGAADTLQGQALKIPERFGGLVTGDKLPLGAAAVGAAGGALLGGEENRGKGALIGGMGGMALGRLPNQALQSAVQDAMLAAQKGGKTVMASAGFGPAYRYGVGAASGAAGGAALGALTGEEGTRGSRALKGALIGGGVGLAQQGAADAITPLMDKLSPAAKARLTGGALPLAAGAVGAGTGALMADEGHGLRGGVIGGLAGMSAGSIPGVAVGNQNMRAYLRAAEEADKLASVKHANVLTEVLHANHLAHLAKNGIVPAAGGAPRPFDVPPAGMKVGFNLSPNARGILKGTAAGAAIGGTGGYLMAPEDMKLRGALGGAIVGGTAGATGKDLANQRHEQVYQDARTALRGQAVPDLTQRIGLRNTRNMRQSNLL